MTLSFLDEAAADIPSIAGFFRLFLTRFCAGDAAARLPDPGKVLLGLTKAIIADKTLKNRKTPFKLSLFFCCNIRGLYSI